MFTPETIPAIAALMRECGQIILNADRSEASITQKTDFRDLVTKYDKLVQDRLQAGLAAILPEAAFVGEEDAAHSTSIAEGYAFIVDPIDGTTNFIKDYHCSCISVGITLDGQPYAGAIYNPYLDEMYTAVRGEGAFLNGKPIHVSDKPLSEGLVLIGTGTYVPDRAERAFQLAYTFYQQALDIRRSGSAALDLCSVAAGRAELFYDLLLQPWDIAAGTAILTEAGGKVTTLEGTPITLDKPCSILATN